ncbi:unnamed protein product, partial [marine sediment metagenome]
SEAAIDESQKESWWAPPQRQKVAEKQLKPLRMFSRIAWRRMRMEA